MNKVQNAIQQIRGAHKRRMAVLRRFQRGERVADIASSLGVSRARVYAMLKRAREAKPE